MTSDELKQVAIERRDAARSLLEKLQTITNSEILVLTPGSAATILYLRDNGYLEGEIERLDRLIAEDNFDRLFS